jgi:serine/threonine protein kinase
MSFLDSYRLERVLSERGAVVTRLMSDSTGARVVVKTLSVRAARDAREVTLFEREAGILKHLLHPAVPRFVDYAVEELAGGDVQLHLVQSYVDAQTLEAWIKDGRSFSASEAKDIMRALADILCALHETSPPLVHRDIKPGNVMRDAAGTIFLVDFGAAKRAARDGTAVGTFGYMAPEQMEGRASPASDVFGVGMTMVFLLTHQEPEAFADKGGVRKAWRASANVDDALAQLINDCIALDEDTRPRDGRALRDRIEGLGARPAPVAARGAPQPQSPFLVAVGAAGLLLVVGIAVAATVLTRPVVPPEVGPSVVLPVEPVPPPPPDRPLQPRKIPASERLGVPGLIEATACLSRAERALSSEARYRSWRKGDEAPTCNERYLSYGLYTLYDDAPGDCAAASEAATTSDALRDATRALGDALTPLTATAKEADSYYEAEDYKDDGCAKAKALHARLLPEYAAVRAAFAAVLDARAALAKAPPPEDAELRTYRTLLDAALRLDDPALPLADRRAAVDAYESALAALPKPITSIGVSLEGLRKWARGSNNIVAQMSAGHVAASTGSAINMRLMFE